MRDHKIVFFPAKMPGLDAKVWGGYKSNFSRIVNLATKFMAEEIMSDSVAEAKELIGNLKTKYTALENAFEEDGMGQYKMEIVELQDHYTDAWVLVKRKQEEAEGRNSSGNVRRSTNPEGDATNTRNWIPRCSHLPSHLRTHQVSTRNGRNNSPNFIRKVVWQKKNLLFKWIFSSKC